MKIHPVAELFPMLANGELQDLADDIKANGLQQRIMMQGDVLLDGRNRLAACKLAGVTPAFAEYHGDSPIAFIVGVNLHRRHLTASQKGALGAELEPELAREAKKRQGERTDIKPSGKIAGKSEDKGEAREQAAKLTGSSPRYVSDAKAIKTRAPDLFVKVKSGEQTIPQAKQEMKRRENPPVEPPEQPDKKIHELQLISKAIQPLRKLVEQWPDCESLKPVIHQVQQYLKLIERMEANREVPA